MTSATISDVSTPASSKNRALENQSMRDILPEPAQSAPGLVKKVESDELINPKAELNKAIVESQLNVLVAIKNKPMELLFRTIIDALSEYVDPVLGEEAIQEGYENGLDVSPEATAERIVNLSTGFIRVFQDQHPRLEGEALINRFLEVISDGIDQGFAEAREILGGLDVLEGDIASNIDKTYALVQQGLDAFRDKALS